jgi:hypothetical protein
VDETWSGVRIEAPPPNRQFSSRVTATTSGALDGGLCKLDRVVSRVAVAAMKGKQ